MSPPEKTHDSATCAWKEYPCDKRPDPSSTKGLCSRHKFEAYQRWLMEHSQMSSAEARAFIENGGSA